MKTKSVGFVGGGRVVSIILGGWAQARVLPAKVVVSDCSETVLSALRAAHGFIDVAFAVSPQVLAQEMVFLAVHPPALKEVLPNLRAALMPDGIVVSLAPKFTIAAISQLLGGFSRIARVIPNAPSIVGQGFNPVAFGSALTLEDRGKVLELLKPLGYCPEVAEAKLEAYAVLTAMGPTYFWYQCYELLSLAESFGLSQQEAREGLSRMLAGMAGVINDSGLTPERVKDLIPIKPLAEIEPLVTQAYRSKLAGMFEKIKP